MIEVVDLTRTFRGAGGLFAQNDVQALRKVSLKVERGAALGLIGESGCGKTTLGRIVCGLETFDGGDVLIDNQSVKTLGDRARRKVFRKVQLIHQDPYSALNPTRDIAHALIDPLRIQARLTRRDSTWVKQRAVELLSLVGLDPQETLYKFPHQLSGGQRQRVVIARALTVEPEALIADEAVSMIDVSLRLGVLHLLATLRRELNLAIVLITHDVAAARYVAHDGELAVIYKGEIVEKGKTDSIISAPVHPYTQALLSAVPVLRGLEVDGPDRYIPEPEVQVQGAEPAGCLFSTRCVFADDHCRGHHPDLSRWGDGDRLMACFKPQARRVVAVAVDDAMEA